MFDKDFIRQGNLKRYQRLYKSTKDHEWVLKFAQESIDNSPDPMSYFDVPSIGEYSNYLVYGNTLPDDDKVQTRLGYVIANGLSKLYAEKGILKFPAMNEWKFSDPNDVLSEELKVAPAEMNAVAAHAATLLKPEKNAEDRKVKQLLKNSTTVRDAIRYATVRAYNAFYNYFVYKNPLVDFLPQDFGEADSQLNFDIPLTAKQLEKLTKFAAKKKSGKRGDESYLISTYKGPRLDDLELAYKVAQVKLLMSGGVDDKHFAMTQLFNDGQMLHTKQGREALKTYMSNDENRKERYKPSLNFDYEVQEGDDLREIITQLDGNIQKFELSNQKRDPDFDIDNVEPGTVVRLHARTELLTDNMFVGEIGAGRSYGSGWLFQLVTSSVHDLDADSLSKALRKGRTSPPEKDQKELETSTEDKLRGRLLYYKTWDGRPDFYTKAIPKSNYIAKSFIEDKVGKDPSGYLAELGERLLDSVNAYIDYSLLSLHENRDEVVSLSEDLSNNPKAGLAMYKDYMTMAKSSLGQLEGDPKQAYPVALEDIRDSLVKKYGAYISNISSLVGKLKGFLPAELRTGSLGHVLNKDGSSKATASDLSRYYKDKQGGMAVLDTLQNTNGLLTEKYAQNERDYKSWLDEYGGTLVSNATERVSEDKDKITEEVLARVGIPPFETSDKKEFAEAVWRMGKDIPTLEELREKLGDVDERALFVYLEDRLLQAYPDIKTHVSKNYLKIAIRGQSKATLLEDGEEMSGGGSESRKQVAERVLETGETDVAEYFAEAEDKRYKHFKLNGEVHTYGIGGYLQKRYSPTTKSRSYFETFEVDESKGANALISAMKHSYSFGMGKHHVYKRNKKDFKVWADSRGLEVKDAMERVGAFADPQFSYNNIVKRRAKEQELADFQKELAAFDTKEELTPEEERRKKLLNNGVQGAKREIKRLSVDTANKSFDRAMSAIGRVPPYLLMEAITEHFEKLKRKHQAVNPALAKLIVPFSKRDETTNDPFQHKDSPRKMSERQMLSLFDRAVNVEDMIRNPLEELSGRASALSFADIKEAKAFAKDARKVLSRIDNRPTLDVGNLTNDLRQLLTALPKSESEEAFKTSIQTISQGLMMLSDQVQSIFEKGQEELNEFISSVPMAPDMANEPDPDTFEVTNKATAYRYIQDLDSLSEDEKLDLGNYALTKMSSDQFDGTDSFMRNLMIGANKAGINIARKDDLLLAHDDVLEADIISDEEEIVEDVIEDETGMKSRLEVFLSKYDYLGDLKRDEIKGLDLKKLRSLLAISNEGMEEGSAVIKGLNNLTDQEYSVIETTADEAEELAAGTLPVIKEYLEKAIENKLVELPLAKKEIEEEETFELSEDDIQEVEVEEAPEEPQDIPELTDDEIEIVEEQPVELQTKQHPKYPYGLIYGEVDAEGGKYWVYDSDNNLRYSVDPNIEPGWHGILWREPISSPEVSVDIFGDLANGLRGLLETHEELLDQDPTGSVYNNILDFANRLDRASESGVISVPANATMLIRTLTNIVQSPTAETILAYLSERGYPYLIKVLEATVSFNKTSDLKKLEILSESAGYKIITDVVSDDEYFFF